MLTLDCLHSSGKAAGIWPPFDVPVIPKVLDGVKIIADVKNIIQCVYMCLINSVTVDSLQNVVSVIWYRRFEKPCFPS